MLSPNKDREAGEEVLDAPVNQRERAFAPCIRLSNHYMYTLNTLQFHLSIIRQ